jgi:predicted enzyme involved in methoxymalonyl-ACP biosynthesis
MALGCPVLGKQVEFAVLSALAQIAADRNAQKLVFEHQPSGRNQMTLAFLQSVATPESETRYVLPVELVSERTQKTAVAPGTWTLEMPNALSLGKAE